MINRGLFAVFKPSGVTSAQFTNQLKMTLLSHADMVAVKTESKKRKNDISAVVKDGVSAPEQDVAKKHSRLKRCKVKVGHGGTLDRFAEGVLVIGIGEDCKKLGSFQTSVIKSYEAVGFLGTTTDTLDPEGTIVETKEWKHVTEDSLRVALEDFSGLITQSPPLYSALKLRGRRYSDYARDAVKVGAPITIQPPARQVQIFSISLLDFSPPHFRIKVRCSSGTYIRSLVRDIGRRVGTVTHVEYLCRTSQGPFTVENTLRPQANGWSLDCIRTAIEKAKLFEVCESM